MSEPGPEFSEDLIRGADELAEYLFGSKKLRRRVYHLAQTSNIPLFRLGSMICGRKSVITAWVETQEKRYANDNVKPVEKIAKGGKG